MKTAGVGLQTSRKTGRLEWCEVEGDILLKALEFHVHVANTLGMLWQERIE